MKAPTTGSLLTASAFALVVILAVSGLILPLDDALRDQRFRFEPRGTSGTVVFVDMDSESLKSIGVWPWPRHLHADLLDRLMDLGADRVVFDVDFSLPSTRAEDEAFAKALKRAGGYAYLAAFRQRDAVGPVNLPLPAFRQYADPVAVNVRLGADGLVRSYPLAVDIGGERLASVASLLSDTPASSSDFRIDYSIDPQQIARIPFADVLAGKVDSATISGKDVIVGASALELRDFFVVPLYGVVPGGLLQALATEALKQNRALIHVPPWLPSSVAGVVGVAGLLLRRRVHLVVAFGLVAMVASLAEAAALLLQAYAGFLLDTVAIDVVAATFGISVAITELIKRGRQKQEAESRLQYLGQHDPLTGALSRLRLTEVIANLTRQGVAVAVVVFDLRRFRMLNDTLGHDHGDELLRQLVGRLRSLDSDAIGRVGGDSFAIVLRETDRTELVRLCEDAVRLVSVPYNLAGGQQATISASAGVTTTLLSGADPQLLLSHADMALSACKQQTRDKVVLFNSGMAAQLHGRRALHSALRRAIEDGELELAYQPQLDLGTGALLGAEALARWSSVELGQVSPGLFIPASEETGLIAELGRWALVTACTEAMCWPDHLRVAVNLSPAQFELSDVVADIRAALRHSRLPPDRLEVEITEGMFVRNLEATNQRLLQIQSLGVSIALDDFGTGYSSLSYLARLPIDKIKIDQSFIKRLPADRETLIIVRSVLSLSRDLGKRVIAEGIENEEQLELLRALGCSAGQGYLLGRPSPAASFRSFFEPSQRPNRTDGMLLRRIAEGRGLGTPLPPIR